MDALRRTPVITAFVERKGRVLLLRRSERVSTYRGMWAVVSGYLERVPLEQAFVELREEVGLGPDDVQLRSIGAPVEVDDEEEDRHWLVYPFLFTAKAGRMVHPDWESAECHWTERRLLDEYETVPGLKRVLSAVWPPFGSAGLWRAAESIAGDRERGSTHLAVQALRALEAFARTRQAQMAQPVLPRAARALAALRPSMAVIPHVMALAVPDISRAKAIGDELADATQRAAERAAAALGDVRRVMTYSASTVCEEALRRWALDRPGAEVVVPESQPKREGLALAKRLTNVGVQVTLITDAQIGRSLRDVQALLVGADAITNEDQLANKVGTETAVLMARELDVPAYAVCQTHKIAPPGWPVSLERQEPDDVHETTDFRVRNVVFDATPLNWFAQVVTERGPLTQGLLAEVRGQLASSPLLRERERESEDDETDE
jgi:translation initiation factor 2B subunit (eIF-2B alpha/beta/delta family)